MLTIEEILSHIVEDYLIFEKYTTYKYYKVEYEIKYIEGRVYIERRVKRFMEGTSVPIVTLGYPATRITLSRIVDFDETKSDRMPVKHPIAGETEPQPDYHVVFPTIFEIRCRLTTTEKNLLYTIEAQTAWQPFIQGGTTDYVWVSFVEVEYQDTHLDTPWLAKLTLICRDR